MVVSHEPGARVNVPSDIDPLPSVFVSVALAGTGVLFTLVVLVKDAGICAAVNAWNTGSEPVP